MVFKFTIGQHIAKQNQPAPTYQFDLKFHFYLERVNFIKYMLPPSLPPSLCVLHRHSLRPPSCRFIPSDGFLTTLHSTLDEIQRVLRHCILKKKKKKTHNVRLGGGLRMSSAVSDCLDLLDLSSDELSLSISSSQATTTSISGIVN